jgi:hypothetical protein
VFRSYGPVLGTGFTAEVETLCPPGTFSSTGRPVNGVCPGVCPTGFSCPSGSTNDSATVCPAGRYSRAGSASCTVCGAGTYSVPGLNQCVLSTDVLFMDTSCHGPTVASTARFRGLAVTSAPPYATGLLCTVTLYHPLGLGVVVTFNDFDIEAGFDGTLGRCLRRGVCMCLCGCEAVKHGSGKGGAVCPPQRERVVVVVGAVALCLLLPSPTLLVPVCDAPAV